MPKRRDWKKSSRTSSDLHDPWRVGLFRVSVCLFAGIIILRLFILQVVDHGFYEALASGQHEIFQELFPERGTIYAQDFMTEELVAIATNQLLGFVYADPRRVEDPYNTAAELANVLGYEIEAKIVEHELMIEGESSSAEASEDREEQDSEFQTLLNRLSKQDDPYEPIARQVSDLQLQQIDVLDLSGIYYVREQARMYPEQEIGGHLLGFVGSDEAGNMSGRYGLEGYFDQVLSGINGYLQSERDIAGRLIAVGDRSVEPAVDGADIVLTIDRTIQYMACSRLRDTVFKHGADGGSVVILDPNDGAVLAMCSYPDYDPATYNEVEDINIYNNTAIFGAYEPGSVFKPITMAAALDTGSVTPGTTYEDTGVAEIAGYSIMNSDEEANGIQTMTQVLEKSLNTGVIFAMLETGAEVFRDYIEDFGFGELTGIELDNETAGDVSSLYLASDIYPATASFGQGIMVTPLQMVNAFATIANGGTLYKPYLVKEIRYPDGTVEQTNPEQIRQVITEKTAQFLSAMLVSVVERGHGTQAGVDGYYVAGKTGTAQVAKKDGLGYDPDVTIGSFAGFAPATNARFAMIVRIDRPRTVQWAESTAAPLFGELAEFLLQYLEVPPERGI
ncbi:MAG: penicillin-binding protein 2 [Candidatus Uhrbacteria bacterium]